MKLQNNVLNLQCVSVPRCIKLPSVAKLTTSACPTNALDSRGKFIWCNTRFMNVAPASRLLC